VPAGFYADDNVANQPGANVQLNAEGEVVETKLTMLPIRGRLISVSGVCKLPDGENATAAVVYPSAGRFETATNGSYIRDAQVDSSGVFTLYDVPAGRRLLLYAETPDAKFAGTATAETPDQAGPDFRPVVRLQPTVKLSTILKKQDGTVLASRKVMVEPVVGDDRLVFHRREAATDALGKIELSGIVMGLRYHVAEMPEANGPGGMFAIRCGKFYDAILELAPGK
jgi:hypothetical protein